MGDATTVAMGFAYPRPGQLERLQTAAGAMPAGPARREMDLFVAAVGKLSLGEWEELHTVTLDLSPRFVPYVGHVVWGESYRRGAFMADLVRAQADAGVEPNGELPDHLEPILRYLDIAAEPLADLMEALPEALPHMIKDLRKRDKRNPYLHLLEATKAVVEEATRKVTS